MHRKPLPSQEELKKYIRQTQTSVTNFIYCGDYYLFVHRSPEKKIDSNKLNGIGGRLEPGEDYVSTAIRETKEETGYEIKAYDLEFSGIIRIHEDNADDWVICCFKIEVSTMKVPIGNKNDDGELMWIHKDNLFGTDYELVDDLNYCMQDVIEGRHSFLMTARLADHDKIYDMSMQRIKK